MDGESSGLNSQSSGKEFLSFLAVESLNVSVAAGVLIHHLIGKKLVDSFPEEHKQIDMSEWDCIASIYLVWSQIVFVDGAQFLFLWSVVCSSLSIYHVISLLSYVSKLVCATQESVHSCDSNFKWKRIDLFKLQVKASFGYHIEVALVYGFIFLTGIVLF